VIVVASAGLIAGMIHVLSGPDHLAAVAPLVADSDRRRWRAGLLWGIGHTSGVAVVGLLALLLRSVLPMALISSWSERLVGIVLLIVGAWGVRRTLVTHVHSHAHFHGGSQHTHVHFHTSSPHAQEQERRELVPHSHTHASFAFGILHGLAGSSHVLGILPALAMPTPAASVTYLAAYGVGNVGAMTAFASALGWMAGTARGSGAAFYRALLGTCSLAAIVVGVVWLAG
jgi:ABC-type nickel/cobalt efflux system permease component RcnA